LFLVCLAGCYREADAPDVKKASSGSSPSSSALTPEQQNGIAMSPTELVAKADIPLYPGADMPEGKSSVINLSSESKYELNMVTTDSVEKVASFYKDKLHLDFKSVAGGTNLMGMSPKGLLVIIDVTTEAGKTHIKARSVEEKKAK